MGFLASSLQPSLYETRLNQPTTFARKHEAILEALQAKIIPSYLANVSKQMVHTKALLICL